MAVKRKGKEPYEVLLRRFNREIQVSGIYTDAKKIRYFSKDLSRTIKRESARRKAVRKVIKRGY
ncbi:30S ribosomal protein S21 [Candidatus Berkelbacteria bacterium CG10_big_fil_rev_8_21_14_0_10_43_14]|uniref:30S ribosomal protein S21 n=1 Tax=Candidatus Berkelbacteria bacterium CG10_big_fil_rev_8_21_14_0_10_43_14 TaxID=1974515 RepID=A0A2M6R852_9BACT|nr:MAG: 30S ribosomal protein S21 [Candidatus Berkelbacteria bacterium CG10_big_fil_rev_8_21_14_0_10_43_14]